MKMSREKDNAVLEMDEWKDKLLNKLQNNPSKDFIELVAEICTCSVWDTPHSYYYPELDALNIILNPEVHQKDELRILTELEITENKK